MENQEKLFQEIMRKLDTVIELTESRKQATEEKVIKGDKANG